MYSICQSHCIYSYSDASQGLSFFTCACRCNFAQLWSIFIDVLCTCTCSVSCFQIGIALSDMWSSARSGQWEATGCNLSLIWQSVHRAGYMCNTYFYSTFYAVRALANIHGLPFLPSSTVQDVHWVLAKSSGDCVQHIFLVELSFKWYGLSSRLQLNGSPRAPGFLGRRKCMY